MKVNNPTNQAFDRGFVAFLKLCERVMLSGCQSDWLRREIYHATVEGNKLAYQNREQ